jgi:hypothetical protein
MGTNKYNEPTSFEEMEGQDATPETTNKVSVTAEEFVAAAEEGVGPEMPCQDPGVAGTYPGVEKTEATE